MWSLYFYLKHWILYHTDISPLCTKLLIHSIVTFFKRPLAVPRKATVKFDVVVRVTDVSAVFINIMAGLDWAGITPDALPYGFLIGLHRLTEKIPVV